MNSRVNLCLALYRRLASAHPHEFRVLYGEDLDRLGEDAAPEAWRRYGWVGLVRLLADIVGRLPAEYLAEIRQDVVYALRVLAKAPGFASVAVLSLGVGIGMCCALYSECRAIVGPAPGLRDPATLATFIWTPVSYPYFERYRDAHQTVADAAVVLGPVPFAVAFNEDRSVRAERVPGHLVSPEYFTTLGVAAAMGRVFGPETEKPGTAPVVVVSDRFWRTHLGADPGAVGGLVVREGTALVAVGSVLGAGGAFALARVFAAYSDVLARSLGHHEMNPLLLAGVPLVLAALAMLACYLPARRATQIDPDGSAAGGVSWAQ